MVGASPTSFRQMQLDALEELESMNGMSIGGLKLFIDMEPFRKFVEDSKPKCDCLNCWILRNFHQPIGI